MRFYYAVQQQSGSGVPAAADSDWLLGWGDDAESSRAAPPVRQPPKQARAAQSQEQGLEHAQNAAERQRVRILDPLTEDAISNVSDMQLLFFGTSAGQPAVGRCAVGLACLPCTPQATCDSLTAVMHGKGCCTNSQS